MNAPATLAAVAALAGAIGLFAGWALTSVPEPVQDVAAAPEPPPREYSPEELQIACLPYMRRTATTLEEAQTRVSALELRIRDKETMIEAMEERVALHGTSKDVVDTELETARTQLAALEQELAQAIDDKARLLVTLARTQDELKDSQIALARSEARAIEAREATMDQQWTSFVQDAQLRICESGNPDRLGQCREIVREVMTPLRLRFKECVRSGAAVPELRLARRPEDRAPGISLPVETELDPLTRGWYISFCDPDLPEAGATRAP